MILVKICGLMNEADVDLCVQAGVHTLGFVVDYPLPVPWNLTAARAADLMARVPPFVNTCMVTGGSMEKIIDLAQTVCPDVVQLHYKETLAEVKELAHRLSFGGIKTVKALRLDNTGQCDFDFSDPAAASRVLSGTEISALLVDSYTDTRPGGTGMTVDRSAFKAIRSATNLPLILAGGLNPRNIAQVIREASPDAVDVLTGVEESPGHKDPDKVYAFMRNIAAVELAPDTG